MNNQERFEDAVHRLAACGYEVLPDDSGYIVRSVTDSNDMSRMHNLDELIDLADLMEWAEAHRASQGGANKVTFPH
jgi:hypothetical protein